MSRGFTWVELLVILLVVGLAVLLAMPVFLHVREASWRARCLSHLRAVSDSLELYATNNNARYPFSMPADGFRWRPDREATESDLEYWENAIQVEDEVMSCPNIDAPAAYAYNGYLHAYPSDKVARKNDALGFWEGFGKRPRNVALPRLDCADVRLPCAVDDPGIETIAEAPSEQAWTHGRGANFVFLDGHAAWRRLGERSGVPTDPKVDPFHEYTRSGRVDKFWLDESGRAPLFMP